MIRWLFSFLLISSIAHAEPVTIRSGEHSDFSRLVLSIGSDASWAISSTSGGYQLDIFGPIDGFSTGAVFERIPRDRLLSLTQVDQNSLFLQVDCDCHLDPFLWQAGQLVIDIVDGPAPNEDTVISLLDNSSGLTETTPPAELPNLLDLRNSQSPQTQQIVLPTDFRQEEQSSEMTATEAALVEGLARAASQGFLDPAIVVDPSPEEEPVKIRLEEPEDLPGPPAVIGQPGIGISSAMDREFALLGDALGTIVDRHCMSSDLFEISSWADENDFHAQVALLAEGLAGEFGEEPREAQDNLARLYLHFGFGAEARSVLSADRAQSQSRQVLTELAGIIDDYPGSYDLIASQAGCPSPAALWAFYVNPTSLDEESRNHILQQFFAMPQPLRGQMAPRMARKFVSVGDTDAASKFLQASEHQDVEVTHDVQATRALIAEEIDDPALAIEVLAQEVDDNARITPESLIRLIELALAQGRVPEPSDIALASSMRQEYRDTPIALELAVTEAKGLVALGLFGDALELLYNRDDAAATLVINTAYNQLVKTADPTLFLEFAFDEIPSSVNPRTENEIARRLIEIGFPERATVLISGVADGEDATERRILRAQADIEIGHFIEAIDAVAGIDEVKANDLRAQAYTGLGEYRLALEAIGPSSTPGSEDVLQFRAGAWDRLSAEADETLSTFAAAALTPTVEEPAETLRDRRAILSQSRESRQAVEGLLQRFDAGIEE